MAKAKTGLERLHKSLRKRPSAREEREADSAKHDALWSALLDSYGVRREWVAAAQAPDAARSAHFWEVLATKLIHDWIPAYRPTKAGRPSRFGAPNPDDWYAAGGGLISWPDDMTSFYQAQLVQLISRLEVEKKQSKEWVFRWLANEQSVVGPRQAAERIKMLPRPYRRRTTSGSIREAFGKVPDHVRENPAAHLPGYRPPGFILPPMSMPKGN